MTKLAEDFIEALNQALNLLVEFNPFVKVMFFALWFFSLQGSISSMNSRLAFTEAIIILVDCFEYLRLTEYMK
jgi:hypothetical protein